MIDAKGTYECGLVVGEECIAKLREFVEAHEHERWTNPAVAIMEDVANDLDKTVVQGLTRLYAAWQDQYWALPKAPVLPTPEPYRKVRQRPIPTRASFIRVE